MHRIILLLLVSSTLAYWPYDKCRRDASSIECRGVSNPKQLEVPIDNAWLTFTACEIPTFSFATIVNPSLIAQLTIANSSLKTIEKGAFISYKSLTVLNLQYNEITALENNVYVGLGNVTRFNASHNRISLIESGVFAPLSGLTGLDLSYNQIMRLEDDMFDGLINLSELRLGNNRIAFIGDAVFKPLTDLYLIDLSFNSLRKLDANWFLHNTRIGIFLVANNEIGDLLNTFNHTRVNIDLSFNNLTSIGTFFEETSGMDTLNLAHNKLKVLNFSELSANELQANHNQLTLLKLNFNFEYGSYIDVSFNNLTFIELNVSTHSLKLNLSHNKLSNLSFNISAPHDIEIDLSYNKFDRLPEITEMLNVLNLSHNNFQSTLNQANLSVETLDLSYNRIDFSSHGFVGSNITRLICSFNNVMNLYIDKLNETLDVDELDLSDNQIFEITLGFFRKQSLLKRLILRNNRLNELHVGSFIGLTALEYLDLSYNLLTHISGVTFDNTPSLQYLNVSHNFLDRLGFLEPGSLSNLTSVDFNKNRVNCSYLHRILFHHSDLVVYGDEEVRNNIRGIRCIGELEQPLRLPLRNLDFSSYFLSTFVIGNILLTATVMFCIIRRCALSRNLNAQRKNKLLLNF